LVNRKNKIMKISEKIAILIGTVLFIVFVTGLAWSISTGLAGFVRSIPFWIIVIFCISLQLYDSYKATKE